MRIKLLYFSMQSGPKRLVYVATTLIVILGVSAFPRIAFASPEATGVGVTPPGILTLVTAVGDDAFSTIDLTALAAVLDPASSTQHYGPYATSSPDSGTCGNDWATDMFNRHFTVFFNKDGTVSSIVEQFKDGSFSTTSGPS